MKSNGLGGGGHDIPRIRQRLGGGLGAAGNRLREVRLFEREPHMVRGAFEFEYMDLGAIDQIDWSAAAVARAAERERVDTGAAGAGAIQAECV